MLFLSLHKRSFRNFWLLEYIFYFCHLLPTIKLQSLLEAASAPIRAHQIGISEDHLKRTIRAARFIRSRYTILDLLDQTGLLDRALLEARLPF